MHGVFGSVACRGTLQVEPPCSTLKRRQRPAVLTEWDSVHPGGSEVHLQTVTLDGMVCTRYEAGTCHEGVEGELWDLVGDPLQRTNLWDDPVRRALRDDLVAELDALLPERPADPLRTQAPV